MQTQISRRGMKMRDGDIYRWRYNEATLKVMNHGNNGGTTYWCCSNIAIWDEEKGRLVDTYWGNTGDSRGWDKEGIKEKLELEFVANMNDLISVGSRAEFNNYDDSDCIDISHANMSRGGLYIKKTAKPSIEKKRRVLLAHIEHENYKIEIHKRELERLVKDLEELTADSYVPYNPKVYV